MTSSGPHKGTVLIYSIHRTEPWWRAVGNSLGFERAVIVSDLRGDGDYCVADDFNAAMRTRYRAGETHSALLSAEQLNDIIARCRVLRSLPRRRAVAMALAMADAFDRLFDIVQPVALLCFPVDRYISDVFERLAKARGIRLFELTPGVIPGTSMLLYRGKLIKRMAAPDPAEVEAAMKIVANTSYVPAYVPSKIKYSAWRFLKIFSYFRLRGWAFKALAYRHRDPWNLHFVDAQSYLIHKPRLSDVRITWLVDRNWRDQLARFPKAKRLFIALPLFPEASIDYWLESLDLIDYEARVIEIAQLFSDAGFLVLVKDHPLQFGFRQTGLIDRFKAIKNVVIVPYEVSGNEMLSLVDTHFTTTGTLGLQAALFGMKSIVTESFYSTPEDFIFLRSRSQLPQLLGLVEAATPPDSLHDRQYRVVENFLRGTINEDLYSRENFDINKVPPQIAAMGKVLGDTIEALGPNGEDWHGRLWRGEI